MNTKLRQILIFFALSGILLCLPHAARSANNDVEKTVNVTVGETFTVSPWGDGKSKASGSTCASTSIYNYSDYTAFSTATGMKVETRYPSYNNTYQDGYYYTYRVKALKAGTYVINSRFTSYKRSGINLTVYNINVIYHVVVTEAPVVTSISIPPSLTLTIGGVYKFSPVIAQEGAVTTLTWASSNPGVATVAGDGTLQAVSPGTAVITCTASNGVTAQCAVTVNPIYASGISLDVKELTIEEGGKATLTATVTPENATEKRLTWSTSSPDVALVGTDGTVVGLSVGTAIVTATTTDGTSLSASCAVTVMPAIVKAESVRLSETYLSMTKGDTKQLTATIIPDEATEKSVRWSSDNGCVSVDASGLVTALCAGEATVTATTTDGTNLSASCKVVVGEKDISSFDNIIFFDSSTLVAGENSLLRLMMNNTAEITAMQFDVVLPEWLAVATLQGGESYDVAISGQSGRTDPSAHSVSCSLQPNGAIRVLCYSASSVPFAGNSGAVLDFMLSVSEDIPMGKHRICLENIVLTDTDGNKFTIDNFSSEINVVTTIPGDPNGDGVTDVADIVATANYILGKFTGVFLEDAADMNADGAVDVADIVAMANAILKGGGAPMRAREMAETSKETMPWVEITPFTMSPGQKSNTVTLDLYNPATEITAFQLDLTLPESLTVDLNRRGTAYNLTFNTDANRTDASYHTLSSAQQQNGDIRILCYSTAIETFWGEDGALINIPITASDNTASGVYDFWLKNIVLTKTDGTKITPDDYHGSIVIGNGGDVADIKLYGVFNGHAIGAFSNAMASNNVITSIDMTGASLRDAAAETLTTGNANTLIYGNKEQLLGNTHNIVYDGNCAKLLLADGLPFNAPKAFVAADVTYERSISETGWYSVCLPFAPQSCGDIQFEKFESADVFDNTLTFSTESFPKAYTPYIFNAGKGTVCISAFDVEIGVTPEIVEDGMLVGTLKGIDAPALSGFYALQPDGTGFAIAAETAYALPFRAVIKTDGSMSGARALKIKHADLPTSLNGIEQVGSDGGYAIYTLQGVKTENPGKGIYIKNGKKYIKH